MKELSIIQGELNAPKSQYNSFGKYKYRNVEDIQAALKQYIRDLKVDITTSDEIVLVGDRIYVKATATITNSEGEKVSTTGYAREADNKKGMDPSQITGAASSYARKYALNGLFAIDDTKDADSMDNRNTTQSSNDFNHQFNEAAQRYQQKHSVTSDAMYKAINGTSVHSITSFADIKNNMNEQQKNKLIEWLNK
ncbi:ERF family protein [Weissella paramesenteroides]|uniref:ERF family protein n=1 Tax=Weissella paramesenteroides TaxID=1249 RepID=UPI00398207D7